MDEVALRIADGYGQLDLIFLKRGIVEACLHLKHRGSIGLQGWLEMKALQGNGWNINEANMAIDASVAVEIAQIRGNRLRIAGVVA